MPVPKRYFHCSQDINTDAELWEFTDKFGDRALRLWLQILSVLDRTQNAMPLAGQWLPQLATTVNMNTKTVLVALMWILNRKWLIPSVITDGDSPETGRKLVEDFFETCRKLVEDWPKTHRRLSVNSSDASHKHIEELSEIGRKLVLRSPNWSKYNRTREHKGGELGTQDGTQKGRIDTPSFPTPTPTPTPKEDIRSTAFDDFWKCYPRKKGKKAAVKAFLKATDKPPLDVLIAKLNQQKQSMDWKKDGGKYIPHPSTWLNEGRWDDEVDTPQKERLPL